MATDLDLLSAFILQSYSPYENFNLVVEQSYDFTSNHLKTRTGTAVKQLDCSFNRQHVSTINQQKTITVHVSNDKCPSLPQYSSDLLKHRHNSFLSLQSFLHFYIKSNGGDGFYRALHDLYNDLESEIFLQFLNLVTSDISEMDRTVLSCILHIQCVQSGSVHVGFILQLSDFKLVRNGSTIVKEGLRSVGFSLDSPSDFQRMFGIYL